MPILGILSIIVQITCAVHIMRTGRDTRWLYFVVLVPGIGCATYFLVEILPQLRHNRAVRKAGKTLVDTLDPDRGVRECLRELEISNNIDNVVSFAEQCIERGLYSDAIKLTSQARKGLFEHDPALLRVLARAQFEAGELAGARSSLESLIEHNPDYRSDDGHLLYARVLEGLGESAAAEHEYEALAQYYPGPEAKYRYARMLQGLGRAAQARALFEDILKTAGHSPAHYRRMHKAWIGQSKQALRELPGD